MVSREANLKEIYIEVDGIMHTYIVPNGVFYEMQRLEDALKESNQKLAETEDIMRRDELEIAQRIILNLTSDKGGTSSSMLSNPDPARVTDSDYWKECAVRIIRALRHYDVRGNKLSSDRLGRIDPADAEALKNR